MLRLYLGKEALTFHRARLACVRQVAVSHGACLDDLRVVGAGGVHLCRSRVVEGLGHGVCLGDLHVAVVDRGACPEDLHVVVDHHVRQYRFRVVEEDRGACLGDLHEVVEAGHVCQERLHVQGVVVLVGHEVCRDGLHLEVTGDRGICLDGHLLVDHGAYQGDLPLVVVVGHNAYLGGPHVAGHDACQDGRHLVGHAFCLDDRYVAVASDRASCLDGLHLVVREDHHVCQGGLPSSDPTSDSA